MNDPQVAGLFLLAGAVIVAVAALIKAMGWEQFKEIFLPLIVLIVVVVGGALGSMMLYYGMWPTEPGFGQ